LARSHAVALADAGKIDEAIMLLEPILAAKPDWLDGQKLLSNFILSQDPNVDCTRNYAAACEAMPLHLGLRLAWFHTLSLDRNWEAARAVIEDGAAQIGERAAFALARIYIASESGANGSDPTIFDAVADIRDAGLDLCQARFWLRNGDPERAEAIALRNIDTPAANAFWPYVSLAWRMRRDDRAQWLDNPKTSICSFDLGLSEAELSQLADTLRALHNRKSYFLEQSVRGGTQTDGQLFFHHDPAIQNIRERIVEAISQYISELPPSDAAHPLLSAPRGAIHGAIRGAIRFEGSWSVRLGAQGYHSCHTHPKGWISSAFYVALPKKMGPNDAGALSFGTPPPELSLELLPYRQIEPKAGRLVLFPSTMWHGTVPFQDGERLTIAFDVKRPLN
jgi:hypothetical protein